MGINEAVKILNIVKSDNLGYCRNLSYTPTPDEIAQAIEVVLENNRQMAECIRTMKTKVERMTGVSSEKE